MCCLSLSIINVFECLVQGVELYGNLPCLGTRERLTDGGLGEYIWMSYDEVSRRAENCGSGLKFIAADLVDRQSDAAFPDVMASPVVRGGIPYSPSKERRIAMKGLLRGDRVGIVAENCPVRSPALRAQPGRGR